MENIIAQGNNYEDNERHKTQKWLQNEIISTQKYSIGKLSNHEK